MILYFPNSNTIPNYVITVECRVTEYSNWSPCSVTCGKGIRMRTREYIDQKMAEMAGCNQQLIFKEMCSADIPDCGYAFISKDI